MNLFKAYRFQNAFFHQFDDPFRWAGTDAAEIIQAQFGLIIE
jgi:hypothetical protein